jgi:hypothetical protein
VSRPEYVGEHPVDAHTAEALGSGQIRYYPMQVLCGVCGGLGCRHCEPPKPPSRWQRVRALLGRLP